MANEDARPRRGRPPGKGKPSKKSSLSRPLTAAMELFIFGSSWCGTTRFERIWTRTQAVVWRPRRQRHQGCSMTLEFPGKLDGSWPSVRNDLKPRPRKIDDGARGEGIRLRFRMCSTARGDHAASPDAARGCPGGQEVEADRDPRTNRQGRRAGTGGAYGRGRNGRRAVGATRLGRAPGPVQCPAGRRRSGRALPRCSRRPANGRSRRRAGR